MKLAALAFLVSLAAAAAQTPPAAPPPGALPPLVVSTDPVYDQYVSRLYVMSTVLPNGRICYVAYGSKGVPPGTDGAAPPNYLTFYYSDDKGATLHIGFFLVPPPEPEAPGAMVDPRIGQTPDGDAIVFFPTVRGGRPYNLALAQKTLALGAGSRSVTLKAPRRLVGSPRRSFKVQVRVVATDAAGNRSTATRTVTVKP